MHKVNINLLELQNNVDMQMLLELIMKWTKKSDSKELKAFNDALFRQLRYIQSLEDERFSFDRILIEATKKANRAIHRAQRAEEEIIELEKEIKKLKMIQGL
jgi:hypothetical protein